MSVSTRGSIAFLIPLASLFFLIVGLILSKNVSTTTTRAQNANCTYKTHVKVFEGSIEDSKLLSNEEEGIFSVVNDKNEELKLTKDELSQSLFETQELILGREKNNASYDPGDRASIDLIGVNTQKWKVKEIFCQQNPGSIVGCPSQKDLAEQKADPDFTIRNFTVDCGVDITYGWVLERQTTGGGGEPAAQACVFKPTTFIRERFAGKDHPMTTLYAPDKWGAVNDKVITALGDLPANWVRFSKGLYTPWKTNDGIQTGDTCCGAEDEQYEIKAGDTAQVTFHYNADVYKVIRACGADGLCSEETASTPAKSVIGDLPVACGKTYDYGWVLERKDPNQCLLDKALCVPKIKTAAVKAGSNEGRIAVEWEYPEECQGLREFIDQFQMQVKKKGSSEILCSRLIPADREDVKTECSRTDKKKFDPKETYEIHMAAIAAGSASCTSSIDVKTISGKVEEPKPTAVVPTVRKNSGGTGSTQSLPPILDVTNDRCVPLDNKVQAPNMLRVVVIPDGYTNLAEFKLAVGKGLEIFFNSNVKSRTNPGILPRLGFVAYNMFDTDYACKSNALGGRFLSCTNDAAIRRAMSECAGAKALVVTKKATSAGAIGDIAAVADPSTLAFSGHELGHAVPRPPLDDEYNSGFHNQGAANCATDAQCSIWKSTYPNACFPGCSKPSLFRPSAKSAMNNFGDFTPSQFNGPSLDGWERGIPTFSTNGNPTSFQFSLDDQDEKAPTATKATPVYFKTHHVLINQTGLNKLTLEKKELLSSYPIYDRTNYEEDYYTAELLDEDQEVIFSTKIPQYDSTFDTGSSTTQVLRKALDLYLPFYHETRFLRIADIDDDEVLFEQLVDSNPEHSPTPFPTTNLCGNNICDAQAQETATSCPKDCTVLKNPYKQEIRRVACDVNEDTAINAVDYGMCIKQLRKENPDTSCDPDFNDTVNAQDISSVIEFLGERIQ